MHIIAPFTENEMRPSKKRTRPLLSNLVEVHGCFGLALLLLAPDALTVCMASGNLEDYQRILERNIGPSVRKLCLRQRSWVFQQDNDPKHTSKSTQKWLNKERWRVLKWPAMSPIKHLWRDLKTAVKEKTPFKSETPGAVGKIKSGPKFQ